MGYPPQIDNQLPLPIAPDYEAAVLRGYGRRAESKPVPAVVVLDESAGRVRCRIGSPATATLMVESPQELEDKLAVL